MYIVKFIKEIGSKSIILLFPTYAIFINFVLLQIFLQNKLYFNSYILICLFVILKFSFSLIILYFVALVTLESKHTDQIFQINTKIRVETNLHNLNPFIFDTHKHNRLQEKNVCNICKRYMPPRSFHCKKCNRCCLKYSHHGILYDVCVGFKNFKNYVQFYVSSLSLILIFFFYISIALFVPDIKKSNIIVIIFSLISTIPIIALNTKTLIDAFKLVRNNETYMEQEALNKYIAGDKTLAYVFQEGSIVQNSSVKDRKILNPYNLEISENITEVFGENYYDWINPFFTGNGDGMFFKTVDNVEYNRQI